MDVVYNCLQQKQMVEYQQNIFAHLDKIWVIYQLLFSMS